MKDKTILIICTTISLFGLILFGLFYEPEFKEKTINELILSEKEGESGIVKGRIDHVIKNNPITQFILNDGNTTLIYYPKSSNFQKNDFVTAYVVRNQNGLYAHKVVYSE